MDMSEHVEDTKILWHFNSAAVIRRSHSPSKRGRNEVPEAVPPTRRSYPPLHTSSQSQASKGFNTPGLTYGSPIYIVSAL